MDRIVIVTGGTRGIGEAICVEFIKNGAKVILGAEKALIIVSIFISLNVLCSLHGYLANVSADSVVMVEELFR